jgi:hypothetical protein
MKYRFPRAEIQDHPCVVVRGIASSPLEQFSVVAFRDETPKWLKTVSAVQELWYQAANGLDGWSDVRIGSQSAPIVQTDDRSHPRGLKNVVSDPIRGPGPVMPNCAPQHAGQSELPLDRIQAKPPKAEWWPKKIRRLVENLGDQRLRHVDLSANEAA